MPINILKTKTTIVLLIGILFVFQINAQEKENHIQALNQVVEDFRTSVIEHSDDEKFFNLFLHDSIVWSAIFTGKSKEEMKKRRPDFVTYSSNFKDFYKMPEDGVEEKFYNVDIDVRDEFATISFDYTFNVNSNIQNWGTEYWSLMLVENSWKITSVTWSMNMERHEKCPFASDEYFVLKQ